MGAKLKNTYVTYVDSGKKCIFWFLCVCAVIIWSTIGCLFHSSKVFQWFCPFLSDLELSWSIMVYPINLVCLRQIMSFKNRLSHSFSQLFFLARLDIWWLGSSMFQLSHAGALAAASTKSSCFCSAWKQKNSGALRMSCNLGRSSVSDQPYAARGLQASNHHRIITTSSSISSKARTPVLDCVSQCAAVQCDCSKKEVRIRSWSTKFHTATVQ